MSKITRYQPGIGFYDKPFMCPKSHFRLLAVRLLFFFRRIFRPRRAVLIKDFAPWAGEMGQCPRQKLHKIIGLYTGLNIYIADHTSMRCEFITFWIQYAQNTDKSK